MCDSKRQIQDSPLISVPKAPQHQHPQAPQAHSLLLPPSLTLNLKSQTQNTWAIEPPAPSQQPNGMPQVYRQKSKENSHSSLGVPSQGYNRRA